MTTFLAGPAGAPSTSLPNEDPLCFAHAPARTLTWLHLSDLHRCSCRNGGGGEIVLRRLREDLEGLRDDEDLRPDLVFVTGDLAFGQLPDAPLARQLEEAWAWLVQILELYGLDARDVFLVPGNHDIDRSKIQKPYQHWLRSLAESYDKDEVRKLIQETGDVWRGCMSRLADFELFVAERCPHLEDDEGRCIYGIVRRVHGLKIGVAGFNSAWSCGTDDDKGHLWLGAWQLEELTAKLMDADVRIALVHHPFNWLVEAEDPELKPRLHKEFHVLLHGHEHQAWVETPHDDHLHVAAGAVLDRPDAPLSYNVTRFDLTAGTGEIWLRCFDRRVNEWKGDVVPTRTDARGVLTVPTPWKAIPDSSSPSEKESGDWADEMLRRAPDDFLADVLEVCRLKEGEDTRIERKDPDGGLSYLSVLRREGVVVCRSAVAAAHDVTGDVLDAFLRVRRRHLYRRDVSYLVGREAPEESLVRQAAAEGVRLVSFVEYQGLIEFGRYVEQQTQKLEMDPIYNPRHYVEQWIDYRFADKDQAGRAVETVHGWLHDPRGHFVLVLGDFGTGKTFLLHELARRLGHEDGFLTPVLIEMRDLEKGRNLDELAAQHFARAGMERLDFKAFRYMLRQGRIALLFDGFDELALRVTYERATEHFDTLVEAAQGDAKVVVTSRTQHFESDAQVRTSLGDRVGLMKGHRIVHLRKFDEAQIRACLTRRLEDKAAAKRRYVLIERIRDLMGLSRVPRMLGFITDLPEEDLLEAEKKTGTVHAADLYQLLLDRWIGHEVERQKPRGGMPVLTAEQRWAAVDKLALRLWGQTERTVRALELAEEAEALEALAGPIAADVAAHQVGSGTLLVRDAEGAFSFVHQSILEWLVARRAARQLQEKRPSKVLGVRKISPLMAEFFRDLAGLDATKVWVEASLAANDEIVKYNALVVRERLESVGTRLRTALKLAGQNLRGRNFSKETLDGADFTEADLTSAKLVASSLRDVLLGKARLVDADLTDSDLRGADLRGADLSRTRLLGADLRGADLAHCVLWRTKLVGTRLDGALDAARFLGAALPGDAPQPWHSIPLSDCTSVAWCSSREILATGHVDGIVRLWDTTSSGEIRRLTGHQGRVRSVCFSPDGARLASGADDKTVRLWDPGTGRETARLQGHQGWVRSVCFSPDHARLASGADDKTVRLWDPGTGRETACLQGHQGPVRSVCFSPDSARLASGASDHTVRLWDPGAGQETARLLGRQGAQGAVRSVCFSPDGARLAIGVSDHTVRLWDPGAGRETARLQGHQGGVNSVCFSPDGARLASGSDDHTIRLWDPGAGRETARLQEHQGGINSVYFSPDGVRLASGADDHTVRLWDPGAGRETARLQGHQGGVNSVCFSPDGARLTSGADDHTIRLWDPGAGRETACLQGHQGAVRSVCFSPDGARLATCADDKTMCLWDPGAGRETARFRIQQSAVRSMCFSPDGARLAFGDGDHTVRLWSLINGRETARFQGHLGGVNSVCFSPSGARLASGADDHTVRLWDLTTGRRTPRLLGHHQGAVWSVCFSPDNGQLASGGDDHMVHLWRPTGGWMARLQGHQGGVNSVCFSPNSDQLASGADDHTVRLWDPIAGRETACLQGHQGPVRSVYFSPDGARLASGADDHTIRIWDVESGRCLAVFVHLPDGWVAYTPEGRSRCGCYKLGRETAGLFWHSIGLCRFEPGELDTYLGLRVADEEAL